MIALVSGTLVRRELDRVEILTAGGVGYECLIPLSVFESLPQEGATITLHTHLAVREDAWHLYGFSDRYDRAVFQRLLVAKGVGPALALAALVYPAILFTIRLKYAEWVVLRTFCPWCAISAVSITELGVLVALDLRRTRSARTGPGRTVAG